MTIPAIEPYLLPSAAELPQSRLSWTHDASRAVLLVHDMQRYFVRFYQATQAPMAQAMANMQALLTACRARGVPVVYSAQPADPTAADRMLLADLWGPGLTAHPEQADIVPELAPRTGEVVLNKTRYSAFHKTDLARFCREQQRDQLWICGVYAHIGCTLTAFDAFMHDIKPFLVVDASMDFSRAYHDLSAQLVSERCGVVLGTASLLDALAVTTAVADWPRDVTHEALAPLISLEGSSPSDELRDLGLDSIRGMELVDNFHRLGVLVESVSIMECQRLEQLYEVVRSAPRDPLVPPPRAS